MREPVRRLVAAITEDIPDFLRPPGIASILRALQPVSPRQPWARHAHGPTGDGYTVPVRAVRGRPRRLAELPPALDAALVRLEASIWPEVAARWSRLTPTGFPIEFTIGEDDATLRWTAEVAGPELPERDRLPLAARLLAESGQVLPSELADTLHAVQRGRALLFGAWIGGRERIDGLTRRFKLYAELPADAELAALGLPRGLAAVAACPPLPGAAPRLLGIEPARERVELYFRLPAADPLDLLPFLHRAGHAPALPALDRCLPDGLRRLTGRRLGLSVAAAGETGAIELALFASARTLFPADPTMACRLAPLAARLDPGCFRPALVTLGLDPTGHGVPARLGVVPIARSMEGQGEQPG